MLGLLRRIFGTSDEDTPLRPQIVGISRPQRGKLRPIVPSSLKCPYCGIPQDPPPQRRRKCRDCGETIHTWTDQEKRIRYFLTAEEAVAREAAQRAALLAEAEQAVRDAERAGDLQWSQQAYIQLSYMQFGSSAPHRDAAMNARRAQLEHLRRLSIRSVEVQTAGDERTCEDCANLDGKVFSINRALSEMPLPGRTCTDGTDKNPYGGRCRCVYLAVIR